MSNNRPEERLAREVESLARIAFETKDYEHNFTFYYAPGWWDQFHFRPIGTVKTWIVRSRRSHPDEWKRADAVVLSYRGKKTVRFNVVVHGSEDAYSLEVNVKTGKLTWRHLNTKLATELKEALAVARR